jgi:hypothetical protein
MAAPRLYKIIDAYYLGHWPKHMLAGNKALDQASLAIYRKPKYNWYNSNLTYGTITACLFMTQKHGYYCKQTK